MFVRISAFKFTAINFYTNKNAKGAENKTDFLIHVDVKCNVNK